MLLKMRLANVFNHVRNHFSLIHVKNIKLFRLHNGLLVKLIMAGY